MARRQRPQRYVAAACRCVFDFTMFSHIGGVLVGIILAQHLALDRGALPSATLNAGRQALHLVVYFLAENPVT